MEIKQETYNLVKRFLIYHKEATLPPISDVKYKKYEKDFIEFNKTTLSFHFLEMAVTLDRTSNLTDIGFTKQGIENYVEAGLIIAIEPEILIYVKHCLTERGYNYLTIALNEIYKAFNDEYKP